MAADRLFLIFVIFCLHGTATTWSTYPPVMCEFYYNYYLPNTTFEAHGCMEGYCDSNGRKIVKKVCCELNGETYPLDTEIKIDNCNFYYCESTGEIVQGVIDCDYRGCGKYAVYTEGECCPKCPDGYKPYCTYNNKQYEHLTNTSLDGCNYVYCDDFGRTRRTHPCCNYNGSLYQYDVTLQIDPCTEIVFDDSCQATTQYSCCLYDGEQHAIGDQFQIDPCTNGYCNYDGSVMTEGKPCEDPGCPNPIYISGECCPVCEHRYCTYNGNQYEQGTNITIDNCTVFFCDETGELEEYFYCCSYNGILYQQDISSQIDNCTQVVFDDSCQATILYSCCLYNGKQIAVGAEFQNDPCTTGLCTDNGQVVIQEEISCDSTQCPNPIFKPDECCPVCEPTTITTTPTPTPDC